MFSIYLLDSSKLFQWDLNRKIKIIGKEEVDEIHFSHIGDEEALVVKPIKENNILIANIPNILLQEHKDIFVYLVSKDKTLKETFFTVGRREKPTDYLYTEIDILNYSSLEKRLVELEEKLNNVSVEETDPTVPDWAKQPNKPKYTAEEVGALSVDTEIPSIEGLAKSEDLEGLATEEYVNIKVAELVNSAPNTLDTIGELATAFTENKEVIEALNKAITNKANSSDLTAHANDTTIHVTAEEKSAWNIAETNAKTYTNEQVEVLKSLIVAPVINPLSSIVQLSEDGSKRYIVLDNISNADSCSGCLYYYDYTSSNISIYVNFGNYEHMVYFNSQDGIIKITKNNFTANINTLRRLIQISKLSADIAIDSRYSRIDEVLTTGNTAEYTPTSDFHPATKKYVDDLGNIKISSPTTAEVGQILEVEEADENGAPTKWKATDQCITSYKYLDRLQETDTHVLFCVDLDNPKYLTYIMPQKYASIHIYKDGVKVAGANTGTIYHTLRLDSFNDSRVVVMADNGRGGVDGYFYYFTTGWSKKIYAMGFDALEYEFLHLENEREYIPTGDYNPATKKYVDDLGNTKISSPTTAEVGQVLVVEEIDENGHPVEWKTVDNSNNEPFIVTVTQTDTGCVSDKTHAEILEAYNKGQTIYAVKDDCIYYLNAVINNSFRFREYTVTNGSITSGQIMINQFMVMYATSDFTKDKVGNTYNYENLNTEDKTLVGAINEIDAKFDAFINAEEVSY